MSIPRGDECRHIAAFSAMHRGIAGEELFVGADCAFEIRPTAVGGDIVLPYSGQVPDAHITDSTALFGYFPRPTNSLPGMTVFDHVLRVYRRHI